VDLAEFAVLVDLAEFAVLVDLAEFAVLVDLAAGAPPAGEFRARRRRGLRTCIDRHASAFL
jgi:hypothetical protein